MPTKWTPTAAIRSCCHLRRGNTQVGIERGLGKLTFWYSEIWKHQELFSNKRNNKKKEWIANPVGSARELFIFTLLSNSLVKSSLVENKMLLEEIIKHRVVYFKGNCKSALYLSYERVNVLLTRSAPPLLDFFFGRANLIWKFLENKPQKFQIKTRKEQLQHKNRKRFRKWKILHLALDLIRHTFLFDCLQVKRNFLWW